MSTPTKTATNAEERPASATFRHDALLYAGDEQFVASTAAFVREGLERDEPTLIAVIEPRASLLREELGRDAGTGNVEFIDMWNVGRNPARIIPAWQDWVDRNRGSGRHFRGIGEPIWAARSPAELVECQQHEQLLNVAFDAGAAWWLVCPYDTTALSEHVITRAYDTHPELLAVTGAGAGAHGTAPAHGTVQVRPAHRTAIRSHSYPHAEMTPSAMFAAPLPEPDPDSVLFQATFGRDELPLVRHELTAHGHAIGLGQQRTADLVLVADELAANSVLHGGGRGTVRLWCEGPSRMPNAVHRDGPANTVCEVRDRGLITDPLAGRRRPALAEGKGAGLWIANQLCDLVQIRSAPEFGTIVRVHLTGPHI